MSRKITIKISGPNPGDVLIKTEDDKNLGKIQSFVLSADISGLNKLTLTSILDDAEIEILESQTEIIVVK